MMPSDQSDQHTDNHSASASTDDDDGEWDEENYQTDGYGELSHAQRSEVENGAFNKRNLKARDNYVVIGTDKDAIIDKASSIDGSWSKTELGNWAHYQGDVGHAKIDGKMGVVLHYTNEIPASIYRHGKIDYYGKIAMGHELAHHAGIRGHLLLGIMKNGRNQFNYFTYTHNTIDRLIDPTISDNKTYYEALRSRYNAGTILFDR